MRSQVIRSTSELDPRIWDTLVHPSIYERSAWLRARSRTMKAAERFVLISAEDGVPLVGAAAFLVGTQSHPGFVPARVLSVPELEDVDMASQPNGAFVLARLRGELGARAEEWLPGLVVSAPGRYGAISYGAGLTNATKRAALDAALDAIEQEATADAARSICFLYFVDGEDPLLAELLKERGYLSLIIDAECYLPILWDDLDGYLASFRAEGRKKIRYEMAAFDAAGATVELRGGEALGPELALLERNWRLKYGRTPPLSEIVADYEELRSYVAPNLRVFVATLAARPIGFTVFLEHGDTWYARFGGFDYSVGNLFLYFNLLFYRPIEVFTARRVKTARYSLKSYDAKRSRGCQLQNVLAYVRPPEGLSALRESFEVIDRAQRLRFAAVASRRITHPTDV